MTDDAVQGTVLGGARGGCGPDGRPLLRRGLDPPDELTGSGPAEAKPVPPREQRHAAPVPEAGWQPHTQIHVYASYFVNDPVANRPPPVGTNEPMLCVVGIGTYDQASSTYVPSSALITSTGTDGAASNIAASTTNRTPFEWCQGHREGRGQAWCRRSPNRPGGRDGSGTRRCGRRALPVSPGSRCRLEGNCQTSYRTAQAATDSLGA